MSNTTSNFFGKVACLAYETTINRPAATLLAAALAIACYAWWFKKFTQKRPPLPPGPPGLPILGNLPFLEPDLHRYFYKLSQTYGPIFKLQLGRKLCIVIASPSLAKEFLKDNDAIISDRDPPTVALIGTYGGIELAWGPSGPQWRKLRRLLVNELMSKASLDATYALRRRVVREMVKDVYRKPGSPLNIGDQMFLTTLNVVISMLWGGSLVGEEIRSRFGGIEFRKLVREFVELLGAPNVSDLFPLLTRFDLQGVQSRMRKVSRQFEEIFESIIAQRRKLVDEADAEDKKEEESKDFLQLMLELNQKEDHKTSLSKNEVKGLLLDVIVTSTDTTSVTVEWAMTELLTNPDEMRKVVEELDKVVGDRNMVEESHLTQLPYLDAVIKETLRLHLPTPLLVTRKPKKTCTVAGYTIPKTSRLLFNAWAIQRDPKYWEHPLQFEPERLLGDAEKGNYLGNNFHFFPFGSGRRVCPGIPMAERMVAHVLAALLHSFRWELSEGKMPDVEEEFGIVLKKKEPLVAIPIARFSNSELYQ